MDWVAETRPFCFGREGGEPRWTRWERNLRIVDEGYACRTVGGMIDLNLVGAKRVPSGEEEWWRVMNGVGGKPV
jgi:hypothetical protein